jgi:hypothetical protein
MLVPDCRTQVFGVGTDVAYTPYVSHGFRVVNTCSAPSKEFVDRLQICTGMNNAAVNGKRIPHVQHEMQLMLI